MIPVKKRKKTITYLLEFSRELITEKINLKLIITTKKIDSCTLHISMNKQKLVKKEDKHWAVNLKMPFS